MNTQTQKRTTSNVNELVYSMLTENTGTHFLDSGGAGGRMWQRNANKCLQDFEDEQEESYQYAADSNEIFRTVSVYHFLTNDLQIDNICFEFNSLNTEPKDWEADTNTDVSIYGVSVAAWQHLTSFYEVKVSRSWNTYNGESDLSQILQGANLTINDEEYILIQIHGGADARGGYTDAKLFKCGDLIEGMIHEYLSEFLDSYDMQEELEHIETMSDYWDNSKVYKGKQLDKIINKLRD
tara:strand:- start:327 stop:1040 length:714 start_codon:yes stop_codon:yes gene_type:complete